MRIGRRGHTALLTFFCNGQSRRWYTCKNRRRLVLIIVDWLIEERLKNWTFQRLLFYQTFTDHDQACLILRQNVIRFIERLLDDATNLFVYFTCRLFAVVALLTKVTAQEDEFLF